MATMRAIDERSGQSAFGEDKPLGGTGSSASAGPIPANGASARDVESQLAQIKEDVAKLAKTVASFGAAKAESYKAKVGEAAGDAVEASQQAIADIRSEVASLEASLAGHVRDKPLQSLGVAAGVGFVLALLARR